MHKLSKFYIFHLVVEGKGFFPLDMLRHDRCVPRTSEDVDRISAAAFDTKRCVKLQMYSASKEGPAKDRWASFGWRVLAVEEHSL
jgi:hypothetical protein